ncbi:MAG: hypothetical protein KBC84_03725 [Proteobacteria bacterium]|nr:hypothetical protein [Pseudomonadota bacterium]
MNLGNKGVFLLFLIFSLFSLVFFQQIQVLEKNKKHTILLPELGKQTSAILKEDKCIGQVETNFTLAEQRLFEAKGEMFLTLNKEKIAAHFTLNTVINDINQFVYLLFRTEFIDAKVEIVAKNPNPIEIDFSLIKGGLIIKRKFTLAGPVSLKSENGKNYLDYSAIFNSKQDIPFNEQQILSLNLPIDIKNENVDWCHKEENKDNFAIDDLLSRLNNIGDK